MTGVGHLDVSLHAQAAAVAVASASCLDTLDKCACYSAHPPAALMLHHFMHAVTLDGDEAAAVGSLLAAAAAAPAAAAGEGPGEGLAVCGLWPELGLMKQSCAANVTVTCLAAPTEAGVGAEVEGALLVVRAARDLPAGTEVRGSEVQCKGKDRG